MRQGLGGGAGRGKAFAESATVAAAARFAVGPPVPVPAHGFVIIALNAPGGLSHGLYEAGGVCQLFVATAFGRGAQEHLKPVKYLRAPEVKSAVF